MTALNKKDTSQWVFLCNDEYVEENKNEENQPQFCKLRHPRTGECALYLFSQGDKQLAEVTQFEEEFRSWFIDQTVQQDGSLHITTPVNPAFLILPYLIKEEKDGKFKPLDQVVSDDDYPECHRLCGCDDVKCLEEFCDVKGPEDLKAYKFNKDKSLAWLRIKVECLASKLQFKRVNVSGGSQAATYVKSVKNDSNNDDFVHYAHGMLSEYLPESLGHELKEYMGIKDPVIIHDKPALDEPKSKRAKTDKVAPTEDYSNGKSDNNNGKQAPKLSAAQKQLSKVDKKGMKNIASFFSPKTKK